ncbi:MAG: LptF/LptG family permease [Candidatus Devosia phytovorans]|uniref:LptF/LptG family permease n=1 Tax=Candidatus Devosia phytovorans TaxID=3121372 RepID=A0AAJ6B2D5_9HYPH|nr:LptF/LptG family permease [Devosia sp.]WEK06591.1 MAG: LptF/LptG family permease [Devosia sp.]
MKKLTAYLSRLFVADALILLGVLCLLLWLVNCLRSFEVISVKGQNVLVLALQAMLTMPPLVISFFYICVGIGLARALQQLQANRELHIIHTSYGLGSLWRATGVVAGAGVLVMLLLSNFIEPYAIRRLNLLNASVAADLVSSTLRPGRFTQVTPGVVILIGGREGDGEIQQFFADDRRDPQSRQTYIAESARVAADGEGFVIELRNGTLQYSQSDGRFSEVSFDRYDVSVAQLSQSIGSIDPMLEKDSLTLVREALSSGEWNAYAVLLLSNRMAEGLRVIGMALMVLAIMGFPNGRRMRLGLPMEVIVMLIAFGERSLSAYSPIGTAAGALIMIAVAGAALLIRIRPRRAPTVEVAT